LNSGVIPSAPFLPGFPSVPFLPGSPFKPCAEIFCPFSSSIHLGDSPLIDTVQ
jgi:hypothetical protein